MFYNELNKDSMDTKEEIKQIAYDFTTSKGDCEKLENRILSLFGVVKSDSELLHTEVFNLANKLAINGFGNEALKMHQICNGM